MRITESLLRQFIRRELRLLGEAAGEPVSEILDVVRRIIAAVTELDQETQDAIAVVNLFDLYNSWSANEDIFSSETGIKLMRILVSMEDFEPIMRLLVSNFTKVPPAATLEREILAWLNEGSPVPVGEEPFPEGTIARLTNYADDLESLFEITRTVFQAIEQESEAPPGSPLGRVAFAKARPNTPPEPDTALEANLLRRIQSHFAGVQLLQPKEMELIRGLMRDGIYTSIFKEPKDEVLVRGISIGEKYLRELTGLEGEIPLKGSVETSYTYAPKASSSWTNNRSVAKTFAKRGTSPDPTWATWSSQNRPYAVVLHARVSDNPNMFVTGPDGLYKLKKIEALFGNEHESIALGPIRIFKVEWKNIYPPEEPEQDESYTQ